MPSSARLAGVRAAVLGAVALGVGLVLTPPASAAPQPAGTHQSAHGAVFVATGAVDNTASQGALAADVRHSELYAVNAGSNSLSVFAVHGDRLQLRQVIGSGGAFPVSVTVHSDQVFVLDARDGGAIQGYRNVGGRLVAVRAWHRGLGLDPAATPEFTHTPGQVAFTPDGRHLVVTTKAGTNSILVFNVGPLGAVNGRFAVASNAGSGTITRLALDGAGRTTRLGDTAAGAGTVDASFTRDGKFLYVQSGAAGQVTAFAVRPDGTVATRGTVTVPDAVGGEGIVAW